MTRKTRHGLFEILTLSVVLTGLHGEENNTYTSPFSNYVIQAAPVGIGIVKDRILLQVNDYVVELTGYSREELVGKNVRMLYPTQQEYEYVGMEYYGQIEKEGTGTVESRWKRKDGDIRDVIISSVPIGHEEMNGCVTFTVFDITERIQTETLLRQSEERYKSLFDDNSAVMLLIDPESGEIKDANKAAVRFYGWTYEELVRMRIQEINILSPEEIAFEMERAVNRSKDYFEFRHRRADGSIRDVAVYSNSLELDDRILLHSIIQDITEYKATEAVLASRTLWFRAGTIGFILILLGLIGWLMTVLGERNHAIQNTAKQLQEKDILLKEIHHRVKNNIANIESLLSLQAGSASNPEVQSALQESLSRVGSMRILYDRLLMDDAYDVVSGKDYIENLLDSFMKAYAVNSNVEIEKNIDEFEISAKKAFAVGIILNELLTNAIKYAFTGRESGKILVMAHKENKLITLLIKDDGRGFAKNGSDKMDSGVGLSLVNMLVQQLKGTCVLENDYGSKWVITFLS